MPRAALLLGASSMMLLSGLARAQGDDPRERARLAGGEVLIDTVPVAGSDTPFYVARGVIDAPPAQVWSVVADCGRYRDSMVRVASSELLSRDGDIVVCRLLMAMPFPLPNLTALTRAVHRAEGGRYWRDWRLVEGDFALHEGGWLLEPFEGDANRTLVTHRARVQPKLPVPEVLLSGSKKETLAETVRNLRRQLARPAVAP